MPTIPRYNRTQTIPGKVADMGIAGQAAGAVKAFTKPLDQMSTIIQQHAIKLEKQDNINENILLSSQVDNDLRAFKQEERQKTGSDSFKSVERGQKFQTTMTEKYGKLATNPVVKQTINRYISDAGTRLSDFLAVHQGQQRKIVTKQATDMLLHGLLKDAYSGGTDFKELTEKWTNALSSQHLSGTLSEEDAITQGTTGENSLASSYLDGMIDRNPSRAIQEIEKGTFNSYLNSDKVHQYHQKALAMEKAGIQDAAKRKKEVAAQQKEALKKEQTDIGNNFLELNLDGKLTQQEILSSKLNPTGVNSKSSWIKAVQAREKKLNTGTSDDKWKTDKEILAALQTRITENPKTVDSLEIMKLQGKGLSTSDAKSLIAYKTKLINSSDPLRSQTAKTALSRLRSAKTDDLFSSNDKENARLWAKTVQRTMAFIRNHPDEDPQDFVDAELEPAKDGFLRGLFHMDNYQTEEEKNAELDKEAGIIPKTEKPVKKESDKTDEKKIRTKIYKKQDGTYVAVHPDGTRKPIKKQNGKWVY